MSEPPDSMVSMKTAAVAGLAGVAGGITGGVAGYKSMRPVAEWADRVRAEDIAYLESEHDLPPMPAPQPSYRQPRKRWLIYLLSILGTGGVVAVIGGVATALIVHGVASTTDMLLGEKVVALAVTGVTGAVIGGVIGAVIGGLIGGLLDIREMRSRFQHARVCVARTVWEQREVLRTDLAANLLSREDAIKQLHSEMST